MVDLYDTDRLRDAILGYLRQRAIRGVQIWHRPKHGVPVRLIIGLEA